MATKSKKAKTASTNGKRQRKFSDDQKITLLVEGNPRRMGSETYKIYELYKNGMTVGDFIKKGGRLVDVAADVQRKHIKVG
jgi:hypothetical protein